MQRKQHTYIVIDSMLKKKAMAIEKPRALELKTEKKNGENNKK